jgi:hypothetical protein
LESGFQSRQYHEIFFASIETMLGVEIYASSKPVNFALMSKKRTKILSPVYHASQHTTMPAAHGT